MNRQRGRLVILSGPSCVGKSPLSKALARIYPDLYARLQPLVLYNSRAPRPGEVDGKDYYFRAHATVEGMRSQARYVVFDVRGDVQALELDELRTMLRKTDVFFEGNPFVGRTLLTHAALRDIKRVSAFMAPLSRAEIEYLAAPERGVDLPVLVTDMMRRKLLRRTRRQKGELALTDLENVQKRAASAYRELCEAWRFDNVIPNHDGEDSENWDAFYYPVGDARKALLAFVDLLQGVRPVGAEQWPKELLR